MLSLFVSPRTTAYADAAGKGGDYIPLTTPWRALDTRGGTKPGAGSTTNVTVAGTTTVPSTATAVLIDVATAGGPTASTYLTVWPKGGAKPTISNLNTQAGAAAISNSAVVPVGDDRQISVFNSAGSVNIIVDVQGYFTDSAGSGRGGFVPVAPAVLLNNAALGGGDGASLAGVERRP